MSRKKKVITYYSNIFICDGSHYRLSSTVIYIFCNLLCLKPWIWFWWNHTSILNYIKYDFGWNFITKYHSLLFSVNWFYWLMHHSSIVHGIFPKRCLMKKKQDSMVVIWKCKTKFGNSILWITAGHHSAIWNRPYFYTI